MRDAPLRQEQPPQLPQVSLGACTWVPPHNVAFVFDSDEPPFGRGLPPSRPFAGGMADGPFAFKGFCPPAASAPAALASLPPVPARRRPLRGEILTARRVCAARAPGWWASGRLLARL